MGLVVGGRTKRWRRGVQADPPLTLPGGGEGIDGDWFFFWFSWRGECPCPAVVGRDSSRGVVVRVPCSAVVIRIGVPVFFDLARVPPPPPGAPLLQTGGSAPLRPLWFASGNGGGYRRGAGAAGGGPGAGHRRCVPPPAGGATSCESSVQVRGRGIVGDKN